MHDYNDVMHNYNRVKKEKLISVVMRGYVQKINHDIIILYNSKQDE